MVPEPDLTFSEVNRSHLETRLRGPVAQPNSSEPGFHVCEVHPMQSTSRTSWLAG